MSKLTAFIDTETTGLLKPEPNNLSDQPYIIELYICVVDEKFNLLREFNEIIKPPIPISDKITQITGIKQSDVNYRDEFSIHFPKIADCMLGVTRLVGHNLPFDRSMLANELARIEKQFCFPWPIEHICTIEKSMPIEQRRLPLSALHTYAMGHPHAGAHRAKDDVFATVRCYNWLIEKGLISQ